MAFATRKLFYWGNMHFPSCILVKIMLYCLSAFEMAIAEAQKQMACGCILSFNAFSEI